MPPTRLVEKTFCVKLVSESSGYSQSASLLAHNQIAATRLSEGTYLIWLNYIMMSGIFLMWSRIFIVIVVAIGIISIIRRMVVVIRL